MAVITTAFTPTPSRFDFQGIPEPAEEKTSLPRAEVVFEASSQSIPAPGAGNNQRFTISCDLPSGYAYVFMDAGVLVSGASAGGNNFVDVLGSQFGRSSTSAQFYAQFKSEGITYGSSGLQQQLFRPLQRYSGVVMPMSPEAEPNMTVWGHNTTADDIAYVCNFKLRFLQFDIAQSYRVAVNAPIPVR